MLPSFQSELGTLLPAELMFPHFAEREAAWLLRHHLDGPTKIHALRQSALQPLLSRPGVAPVLAACGDGQISPHRLLPLADPLYAFRRERDFVGDRAAETAMDLACSVQWRMFEVTFAAWAPGARGPDFYWAQVSRAGGNLVLQVNFPDRYVSTFDCLFGDQGRRTLEYAAHPIRQDRRITMAWARLDLDPWGEDLLIEEIQTDWLRMVRARRNAVLSGVPKGHFAHAAEVLDQTMAVYGRDWDRVVMLAVLAFAVRELGVRRVWLHQPHTGAKLKRIHPGPLPPRSIYMDLPRRFGFHVTDRAPEFLYQARPQAIARLRRSGKPVFWCLDLGSLNQAGEKAEPALAAA